MSRNIQVDALPSVPAELMLNWVHVCPKTRVPLDVGIVSGLAFRSTHGHVSLSVFCPQCNTHHTARVEELMFWSLPPR